MLFGCQLMSCQLVLKRPAQQVLTRKATITNLKLKGVLPLMTRNNSPFAGFKKRQQRRDES